MLGCRIKSGQKPCPQQSKPRIDYDPKLSPIQCLLKAVLSTVPSDGSPRPSVRNICRTDGTAPRPSVPSSPAEDGMSADDGRGRQKYRHRPSSTVTGRHRAVTINTYTVTVERAVQDINRFIYISRLSISSKNSGSDRADVEGSCFTVKIVEKCTYYN
jgi:hypothetical protein